MTHRLKNTCCFCRDPSSVLSTHVVTSEPFVTLVPGDLTRSSDHYRYCIRVVPLLMCRQNTHIVLVCFPSLWQTPQPKEAWGGESLFHPEACSSSLRETKAGTRRQTLLPTIFFLKLPQNNPLRAKYSVAFPAQSSKLCPQPFLNNTDRSLQQYPMNLVPVSDLVSFLLLW